jgi:membrane-anchored glycerophosphoryl diester phosphodiesterase (GDPDase)
MAQIPMLTAHKPGIVPLRPLQFGDIFDGAIKAVRFNPKAMVGLSALVLAIFLGPSAALAVGATHLTAQSLKRFGPEAQGLLGLPAIAFQLLATTLATAILSGLLVHVVGQAVLGHRPDIRQTWRATRGRVLSLLALVALAGLVTLLSAVVLIGPGVLLLAKQNNGAGFAALVFGTLALLVFDLYITTKFSMAAPAIVLEGHRVLAGLRRSFALTRGSAFWRVLGITLLAGIVAGFAGWLLGLPFSVITFAVSLVAGQDSEAGQMIVTFVSNLSALLSGAITTPFVAAVTCLLYIDRRMRLEALDVVLLRESQSNPPTV